MTLITNRNWFRNLSRSKCQTVEAAFANFWDVEKEAAYQDFCKEDNLKTDVMQDILKTYEANKRLPNRNEIQASPNYKVKLFERNDLHSRLIKKTRQFIQSFSISIL